MKKLTLFLIIILVSTISIITVHAKDTLYNMNKYPYEYLDFIETSYNDKGQSDGFIVAGKFKETKSESDDSYQGIVIKYNYEGKKIFEYLENQDYGTIDYLTYSYNVENKIDGYLIVVRKTLTSTSESNPNDNGNDNEQEESLSKGVFIKLSLTGKKVFEKDLDIDDYKTINKIIPIIDNNQTEYLMALTLSKEEQSVLLRYNNELNIISRIEPVDITNLADIICLKEADKTNYLALEEQNEIKKLVKYEKDGNKEVLLEDLSKFASVNLESTTTGYILYGITPDVKVEGGKYSYYLVKYDTKGNEVWESFGEIPVNDKSIMKLLPISKSETETEYLLLYQNALDSSKEVIKLDSEGLYLKKVKKINNDYYNFKNFRFNNDTLYFIGHITCPEEDNCLYKTNSLFLISDEDKVIEVKKENATSAFLIFLLIIPLLVLIIIYKKKIRNKKQNL